MEALATFPLDTTGLATDSVPGGYGQYRYDTLTTPPDLFEDLSATEWGRLTWREVGRPYEVTNYSSGREAWEAEHRAAMPVEVQWAHFNKRFHSLFEQDVDAATERAKTELQTHLKALDFAEAREVVQELVQLKIWNKVHLVEDAVWDPRGKRALFDGLAVERPNVLFLGAADGYEAMQLLAMYGGHAVLVDYDDFCRTDHFGKFPEVYPFLGRNPATGGYDVYHRADFDIDFDVADIRDLQYGREFDVVVSIGLIEHFPDAHKSEVFDFHRRFLKPDGHAVMTTSRKQPRPKTFCLAMGKIMNYGYRKLIDARQLGLYAHENGFDVPRAGYVKAQRHRLPGAVRGGVGAAFGGAKPFMYCSVAFLSVTYESYFAVSPFAGVYQWYGSLSLSLFSSFIFVIATSVPAVAQLAGPQDQVVWELATWPGTDPLGNPQTQGTSGEDWAYSVAQSRTAGGTLDGYVIAGYSTYPATGNGVTDGCQRPCNDEFGCTYGTLTKIAPGGEVEWVVSDYSAVYWKVINTSDGGFLAVGHTKDRNLFPYNPTAPGVGTPLICWPNNAPSSLRSRSLIIAVKYDHSGTEQWKYSYGEMDNPNDHVWSLGSLQTQTRQDIPWDVVEQPGGGFRIAACAVDPDIGMNPRAFAVDIAANGVVQSRQVYGQGGVPSDPSTWRRSMLMGIERWGNEYVAVGTQYNDTLEVGTGDVMVIKLGATLTTQPLAQTTLTNTPNEQDTGFNIAFAGDGSVHVASVLDCENFGECRRFGAGGEGDLVVHRLRRSDLAVLGSTGSALGRVKGFDILVGLTSTADGGTALVSTKQPNGPTGQGEPTDNTDAFVAKLTTTTAVDWMRTYDARTNRIHTQTGSNYEKHQECLYDIIEDGEGGLVIAGNNSSNLDDNYVVRFGTAEPKTLPATTVWNSHLVYPSAGQSFTATVSGDLEVTDSGEIWVDPGRTLKFVPGARLIVEGTLDAEGTTFTASEPKGGWRGITVSNPQGATPSAHFKDVTIEGVTYPNFVRGGTALGVYNAEVSLVDTEVTGSAGPGVSGVWAAGPETLVHITSATVGGPDFSEISSHNGHGVVATNDAEVRVSLGSVIEFNDGSGVYASNGGRVVLDESSVLDNGHYGLDAYNYGEIDFVDLGVPSFSSSTTDNLVALNDLGGILARDHASVSAGSYNDLTGACIACENTIRDHSTDLAPVDVKAETGSVAFAESNYWGPGIASESDLVLDASRGSVIEVTPILTVPPSARASGVAHDGRSASDDETSARSGGLRSGFRAVFAEAREAAAGGEYVRAFTLLRDVIVTAEDAALRRLAYTEATRLLRRAQPPSVVGFLESVASGETGGSEYRPWALRALVMAYAAAGQASDAEAAAVALADGYGDGGHARYGTLAQFRFRLAADDLAGAGAALAEAEAAWPEHPSVEEAGAVYAVASGGGGAGSRSGGGVARTSGLALVEAPAALGDEPVLAVYPNPTSRAVSVALTLDATVYARVVTYDVLGREIVVLHEGSLNAGRHPFQFDAAGLSAGVYVVRATAGDRVATERITVVR